MTLIGHAEPVAAFMRAWREDRLHHAWLLAGPRGIGKASFATIAAATVLAGDRAGPFGPSPGHPVLPLLAAGSHPDFRALARLPRDKGQLAREISVDQVRELLPLFHATPALGDRRVVVVDAADDLNRAAANALLKMLEEPPAGTLFLLVSHAPDRLLPTIRSRCRLLRFRPLEVSNVRAVLARALPDADAADIDAMTQLAGGSPGAALQLGAAGVADLVAALDTLAAGEAGPEAALALARQLAPKAQQARYEAFLALVPDYIARAARSREGPALAEALALWEKAHDLAREAIALSLDPQITVYALAGYVGELGTRRKKAA